MNRAISALGMPTLYDYFLIMTKNSLPTVSVGSGRGSIEYQLNPSIICVDPAPTSFQKELVTGVETPPSAATVKNLLEKEEYRKLVGHCNLFLNYPDPNEKGRYDWDAILALRPQRILLVCDLSGGGGSDYLINYLRRHVDNMADYQVTGDFNWVGDQSVEYGEPLFPSYWISQSVVCAVEGGLGPVCFRYLLLSNNKDEGNAESLKILQDPVSYKSGSCLLQ